MEWTLTADEPGRVCLMQGNEAVVRGAVEAGINFAASYPGSPSSQILGMLGKVAAQRGFYAQWGTNETVAFEACIGASLAGARSICIVKQNGLFCVIDALHCGALHGVKGGLVLITSDDPEAHSSTNEFDSRYQAMSADVPMLEPRSIQETKDILPYAFELSEQFGQIVIVRVTTRVCHGRSSVKLGPLPDKPHPFHTVGEFDRMVAVSYRHRWLINTLDNIQEAFEDCPFNSYEGPENAKKLIVTTGTGCLYVDETLRALNASDKVGVLKLATVWPLPEKLMTKHLQNAEEVLVAEEIDPFMERNLQAIAGKLGLKIKFYGRDDVTFSRIGELTPDFVRVAVSNFLAEKASVPEDVTPLVRRDLNFCAGCPHRATFYLLKRVMRKYKNPGIAIGDIGCYIMSGQEAGQFAYQSCNCMGSGINLAEGLGQLTHYGLDQKVVTMTGDSTFFHTIIPGLINAKYHDSNMLLLVLDNSATAMTGFQPHPGTGVTAMGDDVPKMEIRPICESIGCKVWEADPFEVEETEKLMAELLDMEGLKVLILKQPCATLKNKSAIAKVKVTVDQDLCYGDGCGCDRFCSRVWGCPGNSWDFIKEKAIIDPVSCVGCGVCAKLCPSGAIKVEYTEGGAK